MQPVRREEILDWQTYEDERAARRAAILAVKEVRRVGLGEHLTFLFENRDTIRYQVQEMVRIERMVREADICHELDTYNELLGGDGELGVTLLVEIDDPALRARLLPKWVELPERVYLRLEDGRRVRATIDERQRDERLSAVQYLRFDTGGAVPVAVGADYPEQGLVLERELAPATRDALRADLAS
jgi:hypothetical protein